MLRLKIFSWCSSLHDLQRTQTAQNACAGSQQGGGHMKHDLWYWIKAAAELKRSQKAAGKVVKVPLLAKQIKKKVRELVLIWTG